MLFCCVWTFLERWVSFSGREAAKLLCWWLANTNRLHRLRSLSRITIIVPFWICVYKRKPTNPATYTLYFLNGVTHWASRPRVGHVVRLSSLSSSAPLVQMAAEKTEYGCFNTPLMGNECTGLVWLISLFFFLWYLFVDANFLPLIWRCPGAEVWSSFMAASVKEHAAARGSLMQLRRTFCRRCSWSSAPVPPLDFVMRRLWCCCNQRQRCAQRFYSNPSFPHRSQNAAPRGPSYLAGAALT